MDQPIICHSGPEELLAQVVPLLRTPAEIIEPDSGTWYCFSGPVSPNDNLGWDYAYLELIRALTQANVPATRRPGFAGAAPRRLRVHRLRPGCSGQFWYRLDRGRLLVALSRPEAVQPVPKPTGQAGSAA